MLNHFAKEKSDFLRKKDKSKKGHIDRDALKIINELNSKKDYYTTSSCSGRIVLLEMKSQKKNECNWVFSKHDKVNFKEIKKALENYINENNSIKKLNITNKKIKNNQKILKYNGEAKFNGGKNFAERKNLSRSDGLNYNFKASQIKNQIWFKQQPLILHVACRNIEAAKTLLEVSRKIFRRAGIIGVTNRKVMIEIIGDERLETIIADKDFVADEGYIKQLIKYANRNFVENKKKSERFLKIIKKSLSPNHRLCQALSVPNLLYYSSLQFFWQSFKQLVNN